MDAPSGSPECADVMVTFEVVANMLNILTRDGVQRWLQTPLPKLGGRTPAGALGDGDGFLVLEVTRRYFDPSFS